MLGQFFGAIVGGYLGGKYGPKKTVQMSCLIGIPGWIMMAVAPNLPFLIVGRFPVTEQPRLSLFEKASTSAFTFPM